MDCTTSGASLLRSKGIAKYCLGPTFTIAYGRPASASSLLRMTASLPINLSLDPGKRYCPSLPTVITNLLSGIASVRGKEFPSAVLNNLPKLL